MSTKIGAAFVIQTTDATRLSDLVQNFAGRLKPIRIKQHARLLAQRTCFTIDMALARGLDWKPNVLSSTFANIDDRGRESDKTGYRAPMEDFGMKIDLIPDAKTQSTYGLIHVEHEHWFRLWMAQQGIKPFDWQDSTNRPRHIAAREWNHRRDTWERIMPTGSPLRHGFRAHVSETRVHWPHEQPMRFQPSLDDRRRRVAHEIFIDRHIKDNGGFDPSSVYGAISKAHKAMQSDAGQADLQKLLSTIRLPARITRAIATANERPSDEQLKLV